MVFDLFGLTDDEVRRRFPEAYQHLLETVLSATSPNHLLLTPLRSIKGYCKGL